MSTVTSDRFDAAISATHKIATKVEVLESGVAIATLDTATAGAVTMSAQAGIRGRLDLTVVDDGSLGLVPTDPNSLLAPFGNELRVHRGIAFSDTEELVSLGVFRIDSAIVNDSGAELSIAISGFDRAAKIIEAQFEEDYQLAAGALATDAIKMVLLDVDPDIEFDFAETSITLPGITAQAGDDRWAFCQGIATAIGSELYFDRDGICVLRPIPSAQGAPTAYLEEGENGVLLEVGKEWDREGIANRVIVTGTGPADTPITAVATDDLPSSPTYYFGDFGKVPYFYSSQFITASAQAEDAAHGILQTKIGAEQRINFGTVTDPRLDPSDVLQITRQRAGIDQELHVIDDVTIPLAFGDSSTGSTRKTAVFE